MKSTSLVKEVEVKGRASLKAAIKFFRAAATQSKIQRVRLGIHRGTGGSSGSFLNDKNLTKLLGAIQRAENKGVHIVSMILDICAIEERVKPRTVELLSCVVGNLSCFRHLVVTSDTLLRAGKHITKYLANLLRQAKRLASLICFGIIFDGTKQDFQDFADAFSRLSNVANVRFPGCMIAPRAHTVSNIKPFLQALRRLPKLRVLELSCWGVPPSPQDTPILSLLPLVYSHGNLQRLHMDNSSSTWGVTSVRPCTTTTRGIACDRTTVAICQSTSLQVLSLTLASPRVDCPRIALVIRNSKSLTSLLIDVKPWHNDRPMALVVEALKTNSSLKRLSFVFGASVTKFFSPSIQNALVSVLDRHNWILQYLQFSGGGGGGGRSSSPRLQQSQVTHSCESLETVKRMKCSVKLNQLGRKSLLKGTPNEVTKGQWINTLEACGQDLDALYYFLSMNPTLCQSGLLEAIERRRRRRRKRRRLK